MWGILFDSERHAEVKVVAQISPIFFQKVSLDLIFFRFYFLLDFA